MSASLAAAGSPAGAAKGIARIGLCAGRSDASSENSRAIFAPSFAISAGSGALILVGDGLELSQIRGRRFGRPVMRRRAAVQIK